MSARRSIFSSPDFPPPPAHIESSLYSHPASDASPTPRNPTPDSSASSQYLTASEASPPPLWSPNEPSPSSSSSSSPSPSFDSAPETHRVRWGDVEDTETTLLPYHRVIASLDWDHHRDLSTHLLAARRLKRAYPHGVDAPTKRRKGKARVSSEREKDDDGDDDDDDEFEYVPENLRKWITNQWTSWPLPSNVVPREEDHRPGNNQTSRERLRNCDLGTFAVPIVSGEGEGDESRMLKEVLLGIALKEAKERILEERSAKLKPAVDDGPGERVLGPSVRSVITGLDALLTGLHREREPYVKNLVPGGNAKRKWEQVRRDAADGADEAGESEDGERLRGNKRKRGRATKEQYEKYLKNRRYRLKLRDWSQVLGMASIKGWDLDVVARTAERCSKLFGEDMKFRTLPFDGGGKGKFGVVWDASKGRPKSTRFGKVREKDGFLEEVEVCMGGAVARKKAQRERSERKRQRLENGTEGSTSEGTEDGGGSEEDETEEDETGEDEDQTEEEEEEDEGKGDSESDSLDGG